MTHEYDLARQASGTISNIYNTCLNQDRWKNVLDGFVDFVGAKGAMLSAHDLAGNPFLVQKTSKIYPPEVLDYYIENLAPYEAEGWEAAIKNPPLIPVTDDKVWPDQEKIKDRPDVVWLRENYQISRRAAVRLNDSLGWLDLVSFQFDSNTPVIPQEAFDRAALLLPHMAQAVEIGRSYVVLYHHYQAILEALDKIYIGVCIVNVKGVVEVSNKEANRILESNNGIALSDQRTLIFHDPDLSARVQRACWIASRVAAGEPGDRSTRLTIPRRSKGYPIIMEITPLSDDSGDISTAYRGAHVVLIDPDAPHGYDIKRISEVLGLSQAEAEVCQGLVDGYTGQDISDFRNVKLETTKSQIKTIYKKTKTSNRSDLIRLALSISPPVEAPEPSSSISTQKEPEER